MRLLVSLAASAVLLVGCGSSQTAPRPTPTLGQVSHVGPAPGRTVPASKHHGAQPKSKGTLHAPTPAPLPSPTPIPARAFTATLFGRVTDSTTHRPIRGALVTVASGRKRVTTGRDGRYRVSFPGRVAVPVTVTKKGYAEALAMGLMPPHGSWHYNFTLVRADAAHPAPPQVPGFFQGH
jgi:hypothetical protein